MLVLILAHSLERGRHSIFGNHIPLYLYRFFLYLITIRTLGRPLSRVLRWLNCGEGYLCIWSLVSLLLHHKSRQILSKVQYLLRRQFYGLLTLHLIGTLRVQLIIVVNLDLRSLRIALVIHISRLPLRDCQILATSLVPQNSVRRQLWCRLFACLMQRYRLLDPGRPTFCVFRLAIFCISLLVSEVDLVGRFCGILWLFVLQMNSHLHFAIFILLRALLFSGVHRIRDVAIDQVCWDWRARHLLLSVAFLNQDLHWLTVLLATTFIHPLIVCQALLRRRLYFFLNLICQDKDLVKATTYLTYSGK